jgi:undecaprenyl pyrophosphate phosphatase UppP
MSVLRQSDFTPAQRAHTRRTLLLLLAYAIVLPPLVWLRAHRHISDLLLMIMATVAALPVLGIFASWGRYLSDERDEYHQAMTLRRMAVATNATMGAAVVWGFLQAFGVMPLVEAYWIPFVWVVIQGFNGCIEVAASRRRGGQS